MNSSDDSVNCDSWSGIDEMQHVNQLGSGLNPFFSTPQQTGVDDKKQMT